MTIGRYFSRALGFSSQDDSTLPGCVSCGACCFSESPRHARVTGDDHERLGDPDADELVEWIGNEAFMKLARTKGASHCVALEIRPDAAGEVQYLCRVYERRPQVCRDLERGSGACAGERGAKGPRLRVFHGAPRG